MKHLILLLGVLLSLSLFGQKKRKLNYYYSTSQEIIKNQRSSTEQKLALIGAYKQALLMADTSGGSNDTEHYLKEDDKSYIISLLPVNAIDYIAERAPQEQIIMINEAHHSSLHRYFTYSLLDTLYAKGFRYLGLETLNYRDSLLNERKYPVINSGYYTRDPVFGDMVRYALNLGFTVFAYEAREHLTEYIYKDGYLNVSRGRTVEREIRQAFNIMRILKIEPDAKILIHAGYGHICENPHNMGYYAHLLSNINPLTIEQTVLSEKSAKKYEEPAYRLMDFEEPVVLIDTLNNDSVFIGGNYNKRGHQVDVSICHPRTHYIYNRPEWMSFSGRRKPYFTDEKSLPNAYPFLILAYYEHEYEAFQQDAIPVDIAEYKKHKEKTCLFLPPGEFTLIFKGKNNEILKKSKIEISP